MSSEGLTAVGSRTSSGFLKLDLAPDGVGRTEAEDEDGVVELAITTGEGELTGATADAESSALFLIIVLISEFNS